MYRIESQFTIRTDCGREVEIRIVRYDSGMRSMLVDNYANCIVETNLQVCVEAGADIRPEHLKAKFWTDGFLYVSLAKPSFELTHHINKFISMRIKLMEQRYTLARIAKQELA